MGRGIIPARAGFTRTCESYWFYDWDHPRSRGVYVQTTLGGVLSRGSSPLARGLPRGGHAPPTSPRIIPARAGFTPRHRAGHMPDGGSSPLARGLLATVAVVAPIAGIIPARAGFTDGVSGRLAASQDHPRSRGVYIVAGEQDAGDAGSSPLARGLQPEGRGIRRPQGIIPARAGFTGRPGPRAPRSRDHPRSRGVYRPRPTAPS